MIQRQAVPWIRWVRDVDRPGWMFMSGGSMVVGVTDAEIAATRLSWDEFNQHLVSVFGTRLPEEARLDQ